MPPFDELRWGESPEWSIITRIEHLIRAAGAPRPFVAGTAPATDSGSKEVTLQYRTSRPARGLAVEMPLVTAKQGRAVPRESRSSGPPQVVRERDPQGLRQIRGDRMSVEQPRCRPHPPARSSAGSAAAFAMCRGRSASAQPTTRRRYPAPCATVERSRPIFSGDSFQFCLTNLMLQGDTGRPLTTRAHQQRRRAKTPR